MLGHTSLKKKIKHLLYSVLSWVTTEVIPIVVLQRFLHWMFFLTKPNLWFKESWYLF